MPQVPRPQGQTVAPSGFQPLQHIEAPAGAFGGEIAQALKGAGQTAQDISAQLVAHDKYMTGLANKADSDHYGSQYTEQSYALQADFETNQRGGNAKPAMPEYIKKLADLRAANRKDLTPAAAAMYDADTDHTTRNIISAMTSH